MPAWRRQNEAMSRFLPLLLLGLGLGACATPNAVEEGDRLYRIGRFQEALYSYESTGSNSAEVRNRLNVTRHRMLLDVAQQRLHFNQPQAAIAVLDVADRMIQGHPLSMQFRARAQNKVAINLSEEGLSHFEDGRAEEAVEYYGRALSWDPNYVPAQEGLARAEAIANTRYRIGERLYFKGLEELRDNKDERARTSFTHAATFWGEDSRAAELADQLADTVASESLRQGELYLRLGMIGPAWLSLRDAYRLRPDDPKISGLLRATEGEMRAEEYITQADMAIRVGDVDRARSLIDRAQNLAGESLQGDLVLLSQAAEDKHLEKRYTLGRAYELDNQIIRAKEVYESILVERGDADFEDVAARYRNLRDRIERAAFSYQQALDAYGDGDQNGYRDRLVETIRYAGDYEDALERFKNLPPVPTPNRE